MSALQGGDPPRGGDRHASPLAGDPRGAKGLPRGRGLGCASGKEPRVWRPPGAPGEVGRPRMMAHKPLGLTARMRYRAPPQQGREEMALANARLLVFWSLPHGTAMSTSSIGPTCPRQSLAPRWLGSRTPRICSHQTGRCRRRGWSEGCSPCPPRRSPPAGPRSRRPPPPCA